MKCVFILLWLLGSGIMLVRADVVVSVVRPQMDSVVVFKFKQKSNVFMPAMFGNNRSMAQLKLWTDRYRKEFDEGKCHIAVEGFCKDLDDQDVNQKIARERSLYVKGYLIKELQLKEKYFVTRNFSAESYYEATQGGVAEKKDMPKGWKTEVRQPLSQEFKIVRDTVVVHDTIVRQVVKEIIREVPVEVEPEIREVVREVKTPRVARSGLHVKTDLLGWLLLTPNAGVEYLFNDHWSVGGEVRLAFWGKEDKCFRLALGSPELRYYFGENSALRGAFAGLFYAGGKFNYKPEETGYQGTLHSGGVMMGYTLALSRPLFLEFVAGAGFSHASYDTYIRDGGEDVYTGHAIRNGWRVSKARITLGWKIKSF